MRVALYSDCNFLPLSKTPRQPNHLFNPNNLTGWKTLRSQTQIKVSGSRVVSAKKHVLMPMLMGLNLLHMQGVMAHVSVVFCSQTKRVRFANRCWVQITTEPKEDGDDGLPIVVASGRVNIVQVYCLWPDINPIELPLLLSSSACSPYKVLNNYGWDVNLAPEAWANLFAEALLKAKKGAIARARSNMADSLKALDAYDLVE